MKRVALLVLLVASPAYGYVRTQTSTGKGIDWRGHCPQLKLGGPTNPQISTERLQSALARSADAWNAPTQSCSNPRLTIELTPSSANDVGYDGTNVILWRLPGFCDEDRNRQDDVCSAPNAAAVTTVFYVDKPGDAHDGELLDTDMEINAVHFQFSDDGAPEKVDLGNTLTHELGHVLGLDHTCYTVPGSAPPTDSIGMPVPNCFPLSALPPSVTQATMFNFESPGEINKRIPTSEETSGVCAVYVGHNAMCSNGGGCSMVPITRAIPIGLMALGVAMMVLSYRGLRRRKR
jgi:hypothetical protein